MLTELRIDNIAIIQHLELDLKRGLITFTGETGAGKSIILDAIIALLGGRAESTLIRSGADRAQVEGAFLIPVSNRSALHEVLQREELLDDPDHLTLGRELRRDGRTVARVNGRSVNVGLLRELGSYLVDIHGQSEHLSLLNVRQHLGLLDRFARSETLLESYQQIYRQLTALRRELEELHRSEQDSARRMELLTFQVQEIEVARLKPGEDIEARRERDRLANAENLASLTQQTLVLLDEGSPEMSALSDQVGQVAQSLATLARMDPAQAGLNDQAQTINEMVSDLVRDLRSYLENIEFNPRRLEELEERLELIRNLSRKYGGSIEAVLAFGQEAHQKIDTITHAGERIAELTDQEAKLLQELAGHAQRLSQVRRAAAEEMSRGVERELADLNMQGARFTVELRLEAHPKGLPWEDGQMIAFDSSGVDRVEFLIAPNPGEGFKPLVKIASGGETSRLMLALKNVLARADAIPTLIFDEIDQGIGGRVGVVVGEKLWQLARNHQVFCVTHLPQLAAFGEQHLRVRKQIHNGRTVTEVEEMQGDARLDELALMIGGVSKANRQAAREALDTALQRTQNPA